MEKKNRILKTALAGVAAASALATLGTPGNFATFADEPTSRPLVALARNELPKPSVRKAFLVAADDYADALDLAFTKNDVEALAARLVELGFDERNVTVLKTGGAFEDFPTKANIESRFTAFYRNLQPGDFVIVYLSGHGIQSQESKKTYFAPIDVNPSDPFKSSVSIDKILAALERSKANFRWLVVDACRNDPTNAKAIFNARASGAKGLTEIADAPKSVSVLYACQPGKFSYEGGVGKARDVENGFFTLSLLEALDESDPKADANQDGVLSFLEALHYVSERTNQMAYDYYGKTQKPNVRGDVTDFALLDDFRAKVAQDASASNGKRSRTSSVATATRPQGAAKPNATSEVATAGWNAEYEAGTEKSLKIDGITYNFRYCPPGEFEMGSDAEGKRKVKLTKGFWILETEVTTKMWIATMGAREAVDSKERLNRPAECIAWNAAQAFVSQLNSYRLDTSGLKFRLPTEAEWEYACRAGTTGPFAGSVNSICNHQGNAYGLGNVKELDPNPWGIYDMHGNIAEWCSDWYAEYDPTEEETLVDPTGPRRGERRVLRGGSSHDDARECSSSAREIGYVNDTYENQGFRVVLGR